MSIDARCYIEKNYETVIKLIYTIAKIVKIKKFKFLKIIIVIDMIWKEEFRTIYCHTDIFSGEEDMSENDFKQQLIKQLMKYNKSFNKDGVLLSLTSNKNSINFFKTLCSFFGGYIRESDHDNSEFYYVNYDKSIAFSEIFKNK